MSLNTRDKDGYPLEGVDIVRPKKPSKMAELMKLLQEANRREEKEREEADYWRRAYPPTQQGLYSASIRRSLFRMQTRQSLHRSRRTPTRSVRLVIEEEKPFGL